MSAAVGVGQAPDVGTETAPTLQAQWLTRGVLLLLLAVAAFAAVRLAASLAAIADPGGREWGEGMTLDHARRIVRGEPLYQPFGTSFLSITSYTPLYYYLLAGFELVLGPGLGFLPGRLVSLLSTMACMGLIGKMVMVRTGDWRAAALGGLLFLGVGLPSHPTAPWPGLQKEAMPALALALAALAAIDAGRVSLPRILLAAALASLAILTKQTMGVVALAVAAHLWTQTPRGALAFAAVVAALAGTVSLAFELLGGSFLGGTIGSTVNPFRLEVLLGYLPVVMLLMGGLLIVALLHVVTLWRRDRAHFHDAAVYAWLGGALLMAATLPKLGTNPSHWLLVAAMSTVVVPVGLWRLSHAAAFGGLNGLRRASIGLLTAGLILLSPFVLQSAVSAKDLVRPAAGYRAEFAQLLERVRTEPQDVLADPQDVLPLAGRVVVTEPWAMSLAYSESLVGWQLEPVLQAVCGGRFGALVLKYPLEDEGKDEFIPRWPQPVLAALRETMSFEAQLANRYVYRWSKPCAS